GLADDFRGGAGGGGGGEAAARRFQSAGVEVRIRHYLHGAARP
ncbi:hypothetical protein, partial [Pseudomonas aeruginosa]